MNFSLMKNLLKYHLETFLRQQHTIVVSACLEPLKQQRLKQFYVRLLHLLKQVLSRISLLRPLIHLSLVTLLKLLMQCSLCQSTRTIKSMLLYVDHLYSVMQQHENLMPMLLLNVVYLTVVLGYYQSMVLR